MESVRRWLYGKKVYLLCLAEILTTSVAWAAGEVATQEALVLVWTGGLGMAFRAAISKVIGSLQY